MMTAITLKTKKNAFTLVEMLVVTAIIIFLLGVVIFMSGKAKTRTAIVQSDFIQIATALGQYKARFAAYPSTGGMTTFSDTMIITSLVKDIVGVLNLDKTPMTALLEVNESKREGNKFLDPYGRKQVYRYASDGDNYIIECAGVDASFTSTDDNIRFNK